VARNCRKVTPCLNQGVNDAVQANKVVWKALLQDKAESCLHSRYAETLKFALLMVKISKMGYWDYFGHKLDSNYRKAKKNFVASGLGLRCKRSRTARSIKDLKYDLLSN